MKSIVVSAFQQPEAPKKKKIVPRDCERAHERLIEDYFSNKSLCTNEMFILPQVLDV